MVLKENGNCKLSISKTILRKLHRLGRLAYLVIVVEIGIVVDQLKILSDSSGPRPTGFCSINDIPDLLDIINPFPSLYEFRQKGSFFDVIEQVPQARAL